MGFFDKIKQSLTRTKEQFVGRFDDIVRRADEPAQRSRPIDVETVEALEEALISADVGVAATEQIVKAVRDRRSRGESLGPRSFSEGGLRALVKAEILAILQSAEKPMVSGSPQVVLIVGVNGTGKTTTVGKLARVITDAGLTPLICAPTRFAPPRSSSCRCGRPAPAWTSSAPRGAPIPPPSCSTPSPPARRASATSSWSTPPDASTRAST
jgi:fused signal recognition particle receptor